jgi:hypothetical protein
VLLNAFNPIFHYGWATEYRYSAKVSGAGSLKR